MVTIQTCSTLPDAQVLQSYLGGSGIPSFLPDEMTLQNYWLWTNAIGGIRIQVAEEDVERAREILRDRIGAAPAPATKICPHCGAAMKESVASLDLFSKIALAFVAQIPLRAKTAWKCPQCGATESEVSR
jgi:rubredoxin